MAKYYQGGSMKNGLMWFYHSWNSVMNLKYNPIGYVRDTSVQMYLMIVLSLLWTLTFCGLIAGWMNVIPLVYGHIAFISVSYTHLTLPTIYSV